MSGELRVLVGIPASGKSTLAHQWLADGEVDMVVSSDAVRAELTGDMRDLSRDADVWRTVEGRVAAGLGADVRVAIDSTNLIPEYRKRWVDMARSFGVVPVAFRVPCDFGLALFRNSDRDDPVPLDAMERMWENWVFHCKAPILEAEGFRVAVPVQ